MKVSSPTAALIELVKMEDIVKMTINMISFDIQNRAELLQ